MNEVLTKKLVLDVAFTFGDVVFLRVCNERKPGMVTGMSVNRSSMTYRVCWGDNRGESWHFDYELTGEYLPSFES